MPFSKRQFWLLAIALAALVIMSLFAAPGGKRLQSGSTYGRSPDGYGAWYAFMESRGVTIQRWQKPLAPLFQSGAPKTPAIETANPQQTAEMRRRRDTETVMALTAAAAAPSPLTPHPSPLPAAPITLLQISNGEPLSVASVSWVERGNVLILLGVRTMATKAPFEGTIASSSGPVQIQTSRRKTDLNAKSKPLLGDSFGAVAWQQTMGQGTVIFASTPHLAANAYQSFTGNFEFLETLVAAPNLPIWVDEYSHGYKDADVIQQETSGNLLSYLAKTPLLLIVVQIIVIMLVLIWGQNQRLGPAIALTTPVVNNSEAYIQAMAGVLCKAESSEFIVNTISKAEQLAIQKALGLGAEPLPLAMLLDAWTQQTNQPAATLDAALNPTKRPRHINEAALLKWLEAIKTVRQQLKLQR